MNQILWDNGTQLFMTHYAKTGWENWDDWGPYVLHHNLFLVSLSLPPQQGPSLHIFIMYQICQPT